MRFVTKRNITKQHHPGVFAVDLPGVDTGLNQERRPPIGPQFIGMVCAFLAGNYDNKLASSHRVTKDVQLDQR